MGSGEAPTTFRVVPPGAGLGGAAGVSVFAAGVSAVRGCRRSRPTQAEGQGAGQEQDASFFMVHFSFSLFLKGRWYSQIRAQKTPLNQIQDESPSGFVVPPCFTCLTTGALWSTGILPRAGGAPVAACACGSQPRRSRPSSPKPSVPVSIIPGSLCRISGYSSLPRVLRALFSSLGLHLVYNGRRSCQSHILHKRGAAKQLLLPPL